MFLTSSARIAVTSGACPRLIATCGSQRPLPFFNVSVHCPPSAVALKKDSLLFLNGGDLYVCSYIVQRYFKSRNKSMKIPDWSFFHP